MATYHVRPRDDGWECKKRGGARASAVMITKVQAMSKARGIADPGDTIVVHNADGSVNRRNQVTGGQKMRQSRAKQAFDGNLRF